MATTTHLIAKPQKTYGTNHVTIELKPLPSKTPPLPEVIATLGLKLKEYESTWKYKLQDFTENHKVASIVSVLVAGALVGAGIFALIQDQVTATTYLSDIIGFYIICGVFGATTSIMMSTLLLMLTNSARVTVENTRSYLNKAKQELAFENFMQLLEEFFQDPRTDKMPAILKEFSSVPNAQFPLPRTISYNIQKEGHRAVLNCLLLYTFLRTQKQSWDQQNLRELCANLEIPTPSTLAIEYFEEHRSKMLPFIPIKKD